MKNRVIKLRNLKLVLFIALILSLVICLSFAFKANVSAAYNYGPLDEVASAESLVVSRILDSSNLKNSNNESVDYTFGNINDVAVDDNYVYIADGSNNVIVVLDENLNFVKKFPEDASLKGPRGLYITDEYIYVCDYNNNRIAIFDKEYNFVRQVDTPDDVAFQDYEFRPKKITVTRTGRMYVIAEGINEGIIDFNPDGTFSRYYGMNTVTLSAWKAFWLLFTSEEQQAAQGYNFGASLTNLVIDKDEYIYTVSSNADSTNYIKKLNFKGSDVLTRNGFFEQRGELTDTADPNVPNGSSSFIDIDVNDYGTYIVLDQTRGRIFAYDFEGNLLYIGGMLGTVTTGITGTISGTFKNPEALCYFKNHILVVDSTNKNLVVFDYTEFGQLINEATEYYYNNEYEKAAKIWEKVLALNTNYFLAYSGIGKAQLRAGDYENAMTNLKLGYDTYNYSRAYEQYRYNKVSKFIPYVIGVVLVGVVFILVKIGINNTKREEDNE